MKISPISYKFKTKTAFSVSTKYFFTQNHSAHGSIWYEFQEQSNRCASEYSISLWKPEIENVHKKISPISYKFKTKTEFSASTKYLTLKIIEHNNPFDMKSKSNLKLCFQFLHLTLKIWNKKFGLKISETSNEFKTKTAISAPP